MVWDSSLRGGEARLWKLVEERSRHGADVEAIDQRIWDLFGETWSIVFTDLSGFSRQVSDFGILHFLQTIYEHRNLLLPIVEAHDGILVKAEADSFLLLFRKPATALRCAIAMQHECSRVNERRKPEEQILLCLGIGYGRILRVGTDDVWGREVNGASKLGEDAAEAQEILLTADAYEELKGHPDVEFEVLERTVTGTDRNYRVRY